MMELKEYQRAAFDTLARWLVSLPSKRAQTASLFEVQK